MIGVIITLNFLFLDRAHKAFVFIQTLINSSIITPYFFEAHKCHIYRFSILKFTNVKWFYAFLVYMRIFFQRTIFPTLSSVFFFVLRIGVIIDILKFKFSLFFPFKRMRHLILITLWSFFHMLLSPFLLLNTILNEYQCKYVIHQLTFDLKVFSDVSVSNCHQHKETVHYHPVVK